MHMREEPDQRARFERLVIPHLGAAYNVARWLTRNDHDAEDVVQEAYLRAFRYFASARGDEPRAWLLAIVRNTYYTWCREHRKGEMETSFDEERHGVDVEGGVRGGPSTNPETLAIQNADRRLLSQALEELSVEYREAIVLRELEGLSYKEIAEVTNVPLGTVMSRLARARERLARGIAKLANGERS